jgi:hypothetical protein
MARIMCTQTLWRRLGHKGKPPATVPERAPRGVLLGTWAATVFRYGHHDLVIALNERTYLTLVFRMAPRAAFREHFVLALRFALEDLGVPAPLVAAETGTIALTPLARMSDLSMAGTLTDLRHHCAFELSDHADLRTVQLNLNDMPHANRPAPHVPADAVQQLFGLGRRRTSFIH